MECFERNLVLFGFEVDFVLGNGDCCFSSIVKGIYKVFICKDNVNNFDFCVFIDNIGFKNFLDEDINFLRFLFCQEIKEYIENYSNWVDFDINDELFKFLELGWFNSLLGDFCVFVCSNFFYILIVVIIFIFGVLYILFILLIICNKSVIFIVYNYFGFGYYDVM